MCAFMCKTQNPPHSKIGDKLVLFSVEDYFSSQTCSISTQSTKIT